VSEAADRGAALLELGRPEAAVGHLNRALAADPNDARALCLLALAHLRLEEPAKAEQAARGAVAADPEAEWGYRLLAVALGALKRPKEARDAALQASRLAPEEALAHVVLADALQAAGDEAGAEAAARHAIVLNPESPTAHSQLGAILLRQDRAAEAEPALAAAARLNPEDAAVVNDLAVARLRSRRKDAALSGFEDAAAIDPGSDVARHNILATGGAGRSRVYRRLTVVLVVLGLIALAANPILGVMVMALAAAVEWFRRADIKNTLSPAAQGLLAADIRARRFKPQRWDWRWPTRLRPWWWLLLVRLPPPILLAVNLLVLAGALAGRIVFWIVAMGIALPFSGRRALRWWRLRHPGASSWRPPA
jgi:tetratricopeptide (TPR) repeat protein